MKSLAKCLIFSVAACLILMGCSSDSSDDDDTTTPSVMLSASTALKNSGFGIGCYIESSSSTQCLCFESSTIYTADNLSDSSYCKKLDGGPTLTTENIVLTSQTAGDHNTCSTTDPNDLQNMCDDGDAHTTEVTVLADTAHTLTFDTATRILE